MKSREVSSFFWIAFDPPVLPNLQPASRSDSWRRRLGNKFGDGRGLRGFAQASVPLLRGETSGGRLTKSRRFVMLRPRDMLRRDSLHSCSSNHHRPMSSRTRHRSRTFSHSSNSRVKPSHELFEARLSPAHASTSKHSGHTRTKPTCSRVCRDPLMHAISVSMSLVSR